MRNSKKNLMLFKAVGLLAVFFNEACGIGLPILDPIGKVLNPLEKVLNPLDKVLNPLEKVLDPLEKVLNPLDKVLDPLSKELDLVNIVKNISKSLSDPLKVGEVIGDKIYNVSKKLPDTLDAVGDIIDIIPNSIDTVKNITELLATTAVFVKNNITLNCFGIPIRVFADVVQEIFTQTTRASDVKFYFSSRKQPDYLTVQVDEKFSLQGIDYNILRPTVVLVHGFMSSGKVSWLRDMKDAILKMNDANVIVVDWQSGSNTWNYYSAAISTRIVGQQIAKLFARIRELASTSYNIPDMSHWGMLYLIGHSLGSHISGHAAFLIKEDQKHQNKQWIVKRITGLDPAQPCFRTADETLKLDKNDAPFVDVIHTNARHLLFLGLGLPHQLGYVDFYPNGGKTQPGCFDIDTSFWNLILLPRTIIKEAMCSHGRSYAFLTESIINVVNNNCTFVGYKWDRSSAPLTELSKAQCVNSFCTSMGIDSESYYPYNTGVFYVPTRSVSPFCISVTDENN